MTPTGLLPSYHNYTSYTNIGDRMALHLLLHWAKNIRDREGNDIVKRLVTPKKKTFLYIFISDFMTVETRRGNSIDRARSSRQPPRVHAFLIVQMFWMDIVLNTFNSPLWGGGGVQNENGCQSVASLSKRFVRC